ncbi:MAG: hypothetical protein Q9225_000926 [Loekoesia sp. 1 TL-2023]
MASYIIVGAGVFGASTAYHLKKNSPSASVLLLDRTEPPCPVAASHDINKIVRAGYEDLFYCDLALKALHSWKTDPFYQKWFHPSGFLTITDKNSDLIDAIIKNFRKLNVKPKPELLKPQDMSVKFDGIFSDMPLKPDDRLLFDGIAGIAEADKALRATIQASTKIGVHYVVDPVSKLIIKDGVCDGVQTESGTILNAEHIVLCTGAGTAKLIADSAPGRPELQVGARLTARAVCCAAVKLNEKQIKKYERSPAVVDRAGENQDELSFKNTIFHKQSGQHISIPFVDEARSQWTSPKNIPSALREGLYRNIRQIYGNGAEELEPHTFRICW